jgi:LysR family glycine cleavage system transcriptional activator
VSKRSRASPPRDVIKFPLLHLDSREGWSKWLAAAGVADANLTRGPILNRASMLIDAAIDGQGVALARTTLAAWDLLNKRLVGPFSLALPLSKSYWIVCPKATSALPKIMTFRDWLLAEAADDVRRLNALASL